MKSTCLLAVLLLVNIILHAQTTSEKTISDFNSLSWLEGEWKSLNVKMPGRITLESWKKTSEHELTGRGVTLQGNDTVFIEKLKIIIEANEIHYVADIVENKKPVHFVFTMIGPNIFMCENPQHDFPKKISYQLEGYTLKAQTSGNGKVKEFVFVRVRN
jgi:Domain of unknown function (DUF6265)